MAGTIKPVDVYIVDLMIFYIEMGVRFIEEYGDTSESVKDSMYNIFDSITKLLNEEDKPDLFLEYRNRIEYVINNTEDFGWGIHDSLEESYSDLK